jgi:hypothetical protein
MFPIGHNFSLMGRGKLLAEERINSSYVIDKYVFNGVQFSLIVV